MKQVRKLDMAVEQLEDALKAYFDQRYHSAIVLAGAAEQLFAAYVLKHDMTTAFTETRSIVMKIANGLEQRRTGKPGTRTEKNIGDLLNKAYNDSKHAGTKDDAITMNPWFEAHEMLDRAISNFDVLFSRLDYDLPDLALVQRFRMELVGREELEIGATELLKPIVAAE